MADQFIRQINLGGTEPYELSAKYIQNGDVNKTWADIEALVTAGFTIEVPWAQEDYNSKTAPTAAKLATVPAIEVKYNQGASVATGTLAASVAETRKHIYLIYQPNPKTGLDNFNEYVSTGTAWEKIGDTYVDLSTYAKKGIYATGEGGAGATGSAGAQTITSSSAGAQAATGTATVTYKEADAATGSAGAGVAANTGNAGAATINGASFSFTGTAATISSSIDTVSLNDHNYTPAGSVSVTTTAADTTVINHITGATASAPAFTGASTTIAISGTVTGTAVNAHAAQTLTVSGSQTVAAHSHAVNVAKSGNTTVATEGIKAVTSTFNGTGATVNVEADAVSIDDHTYTPAGTINPLNVSAHSHTASATVTAAQQESVMSGATVVNNVLSFSAATVLKALPTIAIADAGAINYTPTFTGTAATLAHGFTDLVAKAGMAGTFTPAGTISNAYTNAATTAINYVTGATLATAGGFTINGSNFSAALPSLTHSVTQGSFSGSTAYTPTGSVAAPVIGLASTSKTVATNGLKGVSATFVGTAATLAHGFTDGAAFSITAAYTPEGTIGGSVSIASHSHSYTAPQAHTHSIGLTDTAITGTVQVAVSSHTHSVEVDAHTHSVSGHTHAVDLTVTPTVPTV